MDWYFTFLHCCEKVHEKTELRRGNSKQESRIVNLNSDLR